MIVQKVFLNRVHVVKKHPTSNMSSKPFWIWKDDERLTTSMKSIRNENEYDLDSSKTTEMEDDLEYYNIEGGAI
jgi:hypothetical protein